jgi:tRNA (pseudouridine54-N1)-methyltransferase
MKLVFFIRSSTVDITNYTIKDIPGSAGRLDVISRCILAALIGNNRFDKSIKIWIFLDNYDTFIFDSNLIDYESFPKNELLLSDYIVDLIKKHKSNINLGDNPLRKVNITETGLVKSIKQFLDKKYSAFILQEQGEDFSELKDKLQHEKNILFILGDQIGEFLNSKELLELNLPSLSFGTQSYLVSSIIRLIKLNLLYSV